MTQQSAKVFSSCNRADREWAEWITKIVCFDLVGLDKAKAEQTFLDSLNTSGKPARVAPFPKKFAESPLGDLHNVPELSPRLLLRRDDLVALKQHIHASASKHVGITNIAAKVSLHGMGGVGKSALAAAWARAPKVRRAFPYGVIRVTLGSGKCREQKYLRCLSACASSRHYELSEKLSLRRLRSIKRATCLSSMRAEENHTTYSALHKWLHLNSCNSPNSHTRILQLLMQSSILAPAAVRARVA